MDFFYALSLKTQMRFPAPMLLDFASCLQSAHFSKRCSHGSKNTCPLWFVPRKYPAPIFCFCRITPLNLIAALEFVGVTVPVNRPVVGVKVTVNLLPLPSRFVTLLFKPIATLLLTLAARFPSVNIPPPFAKIVTGFVVER